MRRVNGHPFTAFLLTVILAACAFPRPAWPKADIAPQGHPVSAPTTAASPEAATVHPGKEKATPPRDISQETIVAGFSLTGPQFWLQLTLQDMAVIVLPPTRRYLPLFKLLKALDVERNDQGGKIVFNFEGVSQVVLDPATKEMELNGQKETVDLIEGTSDITRGREIFLPPEIMAKIFVMELKWNDRDFGFVARTGRRLRIWKGSKSGSLLAMQAQEIAASLPEAFPLARPKNFSLDFLELRVRSRVTSDDNLSSTRGGFDILQQGLWGNLAGGMYRVQFSEPNIVFGDKKTHFRDESTVMLDRGEWNYRLSTAEVSVGDSAFGLNDLTFPFVRIAGVRINGITGLTEEERTRDRSALGRRGYFVQPQVFEGIAPRGAKVELSINGRTVDTQEAVAYGKTPTGTGSYRFEDIVLPPGSLNEVLITITDQSGFKTHIRKYAAGCTQLLPAGRLAYLGGMGTARDVRDWRTRGMFGGARALYGVGDRFTMGGTLGYQQSLYRPIDLNIFDPDLRQFPESSAHLGAQLAWAPIDHLILSGDASFSNGKADQEGRAYNDLAFKFRGELFPIRNVGLFSQYFRYGPDFFDGQNTRLHDRQGYAVAGRWGVYPGWTLDAGFGEVGNNLKGDQPETLTVDFQNMQITTLAIPFATVAGGIQRLSPSWDDPRMLYLLKLRVHPFPELSFDGAIAFGDSLFLDERPEFFSGLKIPGLDNFEQPSTTATITATVNRENNLGLAYWKSGYRKRGSFLHTFTALEGSLPFRVRSELGYDLDSRNPFLENRSEYLFNGSSNKSVEIQTRFERREWTVGLLINFAELLSFDRGRPIRLPERRIFADSGGIKGKVFLDYNANAIMDPDEPGLADVKVVMETLTAETDTDGRFFLSGMGRPGKVRVYLDINTVPAIYSPTHGTQTAYINPGNLTEINFGITPVISISGLVTMNDAKNKNRPLRGVRVYVTKRGDDKTIAESITASDGSYYIGDMRPGEYLLKVDDQTLPPNCALAEQARPIYIVPEKEPQELKFPPFIASMQAPAGIKTENN